MPFEPKEDVLYELAALLKAVQWLHTNEPSDKTATLKKIAYALQASLIRLDIITHAGVRRASTTMQTFVKKQHMAELTGARL